MAWKWQPRVTSDHDRLILLEQRLELLDTRVQRDLADAAQGRTQIATRLDTGNRRFNEFDLYQQRTDDALAKLRSETQAARLAADNAGRGLDALGRMLDQRWAERDRFREQDREGVEDQLGRLRHDMEVLLEQSLSAHRTTATQVTDAIKKQVEEISEWKKTLMTQTGILQKLTNPAVSIGLAILTTFILRWLFP